MPEIDSFPTLQTDELHGMLIARISVFPKLVSGRIEEETLCDFISFVKAIYIYKWDNESDNLINISFREFRTSRDH